MLLHLFFKMLLHRSKMSFQDISYLINLGIVVSLTFQSLAGAKAVFDVVFQAHLKLVGLDIALAQIKGAGA